MMLRPGLGQGLSSSNAAGRGGAEDTQGVGRGVARITGGSGEGGENNEGWSSLLSRLAL